MRFHTGLLAAPALSIMLAACATTAETPGALVPMAPPAAPSEAAGTAPTPGYVWIAGSYDWDGSRYVWDHGRWEAPRPGYHYVPRTWVRENDKWREYGGHWEKAG